MADSSEAPTIGLEETLQKTELNDAKEQTDAPEEKKEIELPLRFLNAEKGDKVKGMERYLDTLRWRKENRVDEILEMPHPNYHAIMNLSEAYYMGRAKNGTVLYYERPKSVNLVELGKKGINLNEMLYHFVWMTEYCWKIIEPDQDNGRILSVLDLEGVGVTDLVGEVLEFVKASSKICRLHYPERSYKIYLINCSRTFSFAWSIIKVFLDPVTLTKINLSRTDWKKTLFEEIDQDMALPKYGGTAALTSHRDTPQQVEIAKFVDGVNANPTKEPLGKPLTQE